MHRDTVRRKTKRIENLASDTQLIQFRSLGVVSGENSKSKNQSHWKMKSFVVYLLLFASGSFRGLFHLADTASVTTGDWSRTRTVVVGNPTSPPTVQPTTNSVQIFTYAEAVSVAIVVVVWLAIFIFLRRRRINGRNRWRIFFCSEAVPLLEDEVRDVEIASELEDPASERTAAKAGAQESRGDGSAPAQEMFEAPCQTAAAKSTTAAPDPEQECESEQSVWRQATAAPGQERKSEQSVWRQDSPLAECRTVSPPAGWATAFSEAQCQIPPSSAELAADAQDPEKERDSEQSVWGQDSPLAECRPVSPQAGWTTALSEAQCQIPPSSVELATDAQDPEKERESEQSVWGQDSQEMFEAPCQTLPSTAAAK